MVRASGRGAAAFLLVLAASSALAAESGAQRACINGLDAAGLGVARRVVGNAIACVLDGPRSGNTMAECLVADPGRRIARASRRCAVIQRRRCTTAPDFGAASAAAVEQAARETSWVNDLFGADLDAALATTPSAGVAACRRSVVRAAGRVYLAHLRAFDRCARAGLAAGTITDAASLGTCSDADPGGVVDRSLRALQSGIVARCLHVDLAAAFPGACAGADAAGLAACLAPHARCRACLSDNDAAGFLASCHRYTAGVANPYCGERAATTQSIARQWDEEALSAIRIDLPRPPVHARNLYHLAAAMWDAWAAYDPAADGVFTSEKATAADVESARAAAISFAAYRLLATRYAGSASAATTATALAKRMADLGYDPGYATTTDPTAAALGNRIAAAVLAQGLTDGANESANYADPTYVPVNDPLIVKLPGTTMNDPDRWQPLALDSQVGQNGIPIPGKVQIFVGPQWGGVTPFAVDFPGVILPGPPPRIEDGAPFGQAALDVLVRASELTPDDGAVIDISPGALGNNPLGTNAGTGHAINPASGAPYVSQPVKRGDFGRVLAEFWADGPTSETPPGHWNVLTNYVGDRLTTKTIGGAGPEVSALEWDVKAYLAVNGALHDAAVACWGTKRIYDSARPISMIRYMGARGQSSDPGGPSYDPQGLPLMPGVVEVITPASSAPGGPHAALAAYVGEIAVLAWPGDPPDPKTQYSGVRWVRAKEWLPYQRNTFVTPPFAGYPSGHSSYSRAAAEVLTRLTGTPYFPGGLGEYVAPANAFLKFEIGPSATVRLQWATYYDAADQAGQSRIWGGIHLLADDFTGRIMGASIGATAWDKATAYFAGSARP